MSTYFISVQYVQYFWNAWGEWVVLRPSGFIFRPECGSVAALKQEYVRSISDGVGICTLHITLIEFNRSGSTIAVQTMWSVRLSCISLAYPWPLPLPLSLPLPLPSAFCTYFGGYALAYTMEPSRHFASGMQWPVDPTNHSGRCEITLCRIAQSGTEPGQSYTFLVCRSDWISPPYEYKLEST